MGLRPHTPRGREFCSHDILLASQPPHLREGAHPLHISARPTSLLASSEHLGYNISDQAHFSWFFKLIVL